MTTWIDTAAKLGGIIVAAAVAAGSATFGAAKLAVAATEARLEVQAREADHRFRDLETDRAEFRLAIGTLHDDLVALKTALAPDLGVPPARTTKR